MNIKQASVIIGFSTAIFAVSSVQASVIVNGTFDNNTSGWTGSYTAQPGGAGGFPTINTGSYYWGGNNASNNITQIYNLTSSDLNSLSGLGLDFSISADLFGFSSQNDHSIFKASFYSGASASGSLLGSVALDSAMNDPGTWASVFTSGDFPNFQTQTGAISSLTNSILFTVESIRLEGFSNDGYADNLNFSLNPVTTVPVPATVWLLGSGLIGLIGMRKKSKL